MTQIASLPNLTVEIAFNPTTLFSTTQTWTDVTLYVRSFNTRGGRQHFLNRIEASQLSIQLDNRTGFFMNGTVNGTGQIIGTRLPIRIRATWNSVTYNIFWGAIDTVDTSLEDALNTDLAVTATDMLKFLSLRYLYNETLYSTYADIASTRSWYDAPANGVLTDLVGSYDGVVNGSYSATDGVCLYSRHQAIDITGGTDQSNTADIRIPATGTDQTVEFWIIGQAIAGQTLLPIGALSGFVTTDLTVSLDGAGRPKTANGLQSNICITDGYWHHIVVGIESSTSKLALIVDGVPTYGSTYSGYLTSSTGTQYAIANNSAAYIDQILVGGASITEIQNRYTTGMLLRRDNNAADRIAEAMVIAGFGTISAGAPAPNTFSVDGSSYVYGSSGNGVRCQGSTDPQVGNTALDVILTAADTDQGAFFQDDDGSFVYETKAYVYRATGNAAPTGAAVWTDDTTSTYHYDGPSFQLTRDDVDVWTSVIVSPLNGDPQVIETPSNYARWGQSTLTVSTTGTTLEQAKQTGIFLANTFATPLARVGNVQLRSETDNGSNLDAMLGTNLNQRITIKRTPINPSSAGITNTDMIVESINHEFVADPGVWRTSFVLDPYPIRYSTQSSPTYFLIADNTTYGKADNGRAL